MTQGIKDKVVVITGESSGLDRPASLVTLHSDLSIKNVWA